jgi:two-component system nitrate/nitrite response regulator NarL
LRKQSVVTENVLAVLTDRERQIMRLVSEGLSNKEIGRRLNVSDGTIKVHLHHIFQKLEISNRTLLAAFAISQDDGADLVPQDDSCRNRRS